MYTHKIPFSLIKKSDYPIQDLKICCNPSKTVVIP